MPQENMSAYAQGYLADILETQRRLSLSVNPSEKERNARDAVNKLVKTLRKQGILPPEFQQFRCAVADESDHTNTYFVTAPTEEMAQLLAFAADGGFYAAPPVPGRAVEWANVLALAKTYVTVKLVK